MRFFSLLATCALIAGISAPALAGSNDMRIRPYLGFDLQRTNYSYNENYAVPGGALNGETILEDTLDGGNIHIGARLGKYLGIEAGYFHNIDKDKDIAAGTLVGPGTIALAAFSTNVETKGFSLDLMGYIPIDQSSKLELIATGGLTYTQAEIELSSAAVGVDKADEDEFGFRLGGGLQYNITDDLNLRGLVRYQSADFEDAVEDAWTYSAGINYLF